VEQREAAQVERDQADRRRQTTEKVPDTAAAAIWQWSMLGRADRLMERKKAELFIGQPRGRARVESDPSVKCRKSELRGLFFFFKNRAQHGLTASSTKGHRMHGARHPRGSGLAPGTSRRSCTPASAGRLTGLTSRRPLGMTRMGLGTATTLMVHKAWREKYAHEGYREGDVLGFYISLADGEQQPDVIQYRGGCLAMFKFQRSARHQILFLVITCFSFLMQGQCVCRFRKIKN
jgi:hypothetical protein